MSQEYDRIFAWSTFFYIFVLFVRRHMEAGSPLPLVVIRSKVSSGSFWGPFLVSRLELKWKWTKPTTLFVPGKPKRSGRRRALHPVQKTWSYLAHPVWEYFRELAFGVDLELVSCSKADGRLGSIAWIKLRGIGEGKEVNFVEYSKFGLRVSVLNVNRVGAWRKLRVYSYGTFLPSEILSSREWER